MKPVVQKIIVAGVIIHSNKVLIIQRSADEDVFPNLWEIPSGKRESFEKSQDALVREVKEEVGIKVKPIKPLDVLNLKSKKKTKSEMQPKFHFYVNLLAGQKLN